MLNRVAIVVLGVLPLVGCVDDPSDRYRSLAPIDAAAALQSAFESTDELEFLSWDGKWQGTDIDTGLTLRSDGTATLTEYGEGVDSVTGTYSTDESRIVVKVQFSQLAGMSGADDWPPLQVKKDGDDLLLIPSRRTTALSYSKTNAWPLRQTKQTK